MKMLWVLWSLLLALLIFLSCSSSGLTRLGCARARGRDSCTGKGAEYQRSCICQDSVFVARLLLLPLSAPGFFLFLLPTQQADLCCRAGSGEQQLGLGWGNSHLAANKNEEFGRGGKPQ